MTADLDLRCQNFTFDNGIMYQCVNSAPDATYLREGFYQTTEGTEVWICENHRWLDLREQLEG